MGHGGAGGEEVRGSRRAGRGRETFAFKFKFNLRIFALPNTATDLRGGGLENGGGEERKGEARRGGSTLTFKYTFR